MLSRNNQLLLERTNSDVCGSPGASQHGTPDDHEARDGANGRPRPFIDLCRSHVPVAWRTAMAITADAGEATHAVTAALGNVLSAQATRGNVLDYPDDAPAVRPQLIAATRELAVAGLRRAGPAQPVHQPSQASDLPARVAAAFRGLPERWRSVLWLVEVERIPSSEAARIIGVAAEEISALTVKAWAGLTDAVAGPGEPAPERSACRSRRQLVARYLNTLDGAGQSELRAHLSSCGLCAGYQTRLEAVGVALRQVVIPLPEGLLAAASPPRPPAIVPTRQVSPRVTAKPGTQLVRIWLAALGLGIIGVAVLDQSSTPLPPAPPRFAATVPLNPPALIPPDRPASTRPATTSPAQHRLETTSQLGTSLPSNASSSGATPQSSGPGAPSAQVGTQPSEPTARSVPSAVPSAGSPAASAPLLVLPASTGSQLVALDTGLLGIPVSLNVGTCTGLLVGPLSLGCTSF